MTIGRMSGTAVAVLMFLVLPLASAQAADLDSYGWYVDSYTDSYPADDYGWYVDSYTDSYPVYDDYGWYVDSYTDSYPSYSDSNAYASAYASSYSSSNSFSFDHDRDRDRGCKKNCDRPKDKPKPKPSCDLDISPSRVDYGDDATIDWSSDNATSATLTSFGSVAVDGSRHIKNIKSDKTYTLTVKGPGGTATCSDEVEVDKKKFYPPVYNPPVYYPPQTPYVTLSAVPYTGFELGPVGTAIYWSLLVLWCLIAAYLIAVKKAHVSLARRLNNFLFGSSEVVVTPAPTVVAYASTPLRHAHPVHDATDEFVLSQLSRRS